MIDSFWDAAAAAAAALVVPAAAGYFIKRTEWFKTRWAAHKQAREERKNVPATVARIAESVETLKESDDRRTAQYTAIRAKLEEHTATMNAQNVALGDIASMAYGQMEQDPTPRFVCDNEGSNRLVNTAYARLLHCGRDELMQFKYQRFIPERLNPGYMTGFYECSKQHRTYETEVVFQRPDGSMCLVRVRLVPHPEEAPPATHWNGTARFLREYVE